MNARVMAASTALAFAGIALGATKLEEMRVTPSDVDALPAHEAGAGTSGVSGIRTTVVEGDPTQSGPYTIRLNVPANTRIQAHTHRDNRTAVVVAGTWYFGYGNSASGSMEKALPVGSFYTEPAGAAHFAETKETPVVVYITGFGPTDTVYVQQYESHQAPR
jgi:quercetin dioxygenase-like cupin family protein